MARARGYARLFSHIDAARDSPHSKKKAISEDLKSVIPGVA